MPWTKAQLKAIHHEGESILVSAGAGSGKTGVLKERVIAKLKTGVHIDELVILTFTRAAAEEMKTRIINALLADDTLHAELNRIQQAYITTFDAFCLDIVKRYHYMLDLPKHISIADRIMFETMAEDVLEAVIEQAYLGNDPLFAELVTLIYQKGDRLLYETIKALAHQISKHPKPKQTIAKLKQQQSGDALVNAAFEDFEAYLKQEIEDASHVFQSMEHELAALHSESISSYLNNVEQLLTGLRGANIDQIIATVRQQSFPRKPSIRNDDALKDLIGLYHDKIKLIFSQMKERLDTLDILSKTEAIASVLRSQDFNLTLISLTEDYLQQLALEKKRRHLYDFSDIMAFAIDLLEDHVDICQSMKKSIKEIMVDEYQDTNDMQNHLLNLLSQDNLFMVGDIKQSIYGFRDANPDNFYKRYLAYQKHQGGIAIDLRENFRSRPSIISDINRIFALVMDEQIGGINYQDGQSLVYGQTTYNKTCEGQSDGLKYLTYDLEALKAKDESLDASKTEAMIVSADIREKIDQGFQILDLDSGEFRQLRYQDIAILIDRKTAFQTYTDMLSKFAVPVNLYSDEAFIESPEMLFLTNYLGWLKCLRDDAYFSAHGKRLFYAVSRSFVYQIKDERVIHMLVNHPFEQKQDLSDLYDDQHFGALMSESQQLAALIDKCTIADVLMAIYQRLNLYEKIVHLDDPAKKEAKLDYFYETVSGFDHFDFADLIDYLDTINAHNDWDIDYTTPAGDVDAVKLMTFHKSKGLQFPLVYCPGLNKPFNFEESKAWFVIDETYGLIAHDLRRNYQPTFLKYLSLDKAKRAYVSERIRLLYVAFTRAKESLILLSDIKDLTEDKDPLDGNYIAKRIRERYHRYTDLLSSTPVVLDTQMVNMLAEAPKARQPLRDQAFAIEKRQFAYQKKPLSEKRFSKHTHNLLDDDSIAAIAYGTKVHHLLEKVDFHDIEASLNRLPVFLAKAIKTLYQSSIFNNRPFEVFQEYSFMDEDRFGIIDLLVMTNDTLYIVDYKLKNLSDEAYIEQLKAYEKAMQKRTQKKIQTYLFAIKSHELRRIT